MTYSYGLRSLTIWQYRERYVYIGQYNYPFDDPDLEYMTRIREVIVDV